VAAGSEDVEIDNGPDTPGLVVVEGAGAGALEMSLQPLKPKRLKQHDTRAANSIFSIRVRSCTDLSLPHHE
jgi:hypothetical protein